MRYCPKSYPTPKLSPHRRHGAFLLSPQKTHTVWFISILNYGDTENVLINHLLLVIPMSYPCHYTNLCPHKPHKHAHTHTHTQKHTQCLAYVVYGDSTKALWFLYCTNCMCYFPTSKCSPHMRLCAFFDKKQQHLVCFLSLLVHGDIGSVLINHLRVVIPMLLYRFVSS